MPESTRRSMTQAPGGSFGLRCFGASRSVGRVGPQGWQGSPIWWTTRLPSGLAEIGFPGRTYSLSATLATTLSEARKRMVPGLYRVTTVEPCGVQSDDS
jgi:hypothetical protein